MLSVTISILVSGGTSYNYYRYTMCSWLISIFAGKRTYYFTPSAALGQIHTGLTLVNALVFTVLDILPFLQ